MHKSRDDTKRMLKLCLRHNSVFLCLNMFLNLVSPSCHSLVCRVIVNDVELCWKYEAIHPGFSGAGMPLKHFIVHYMKGPGHRVDVLLRIWAEMSRSREKTSRFTTHI